VDALEVVKDSRGGVMIDERFTREQMDRICRARIVDALRWVSAWNMPKNAWAEEGKNITIEMLCDKLGIDRSEVS